jgi:ubiquitin-protein ligase
MNRIMKEIAIVQKSTDMFIDVDEKDMTSFKVMLFGPPDSVYHHGIFIFEMKLPNNYPFTVPSVKFLTGGMIHARIHPNLYEDGKVCLSILNTWAANDWSPLLTIEKVFITIRALLDNNPITHEPSYKNYKEDNPSSIAYNVNARYYSLKSILDVYTFYHTASPESPFHRHIMTYLTENKQSILDLLDAFQKSLNLNNSYQTFHHNGKLYKETLDKLNDMMLNL